MVGLGGVAPAGASFLAQCSHDSSPTAPVFVRRAHGRGRRVCGRVSHSPCLWHTCGRQRERADSLERANLRTMVLGRGRRACSCSMSERGGKVASTSEPLDGVIRSGASHPRGKGISESFGTDICMLCRATREEAGHNGAAGVDLGVPCRRDGLPLHPVVVSALGKKWLCGHSLPSTPGAAAVEAQGLGALAPICTGSRALSDGLRGPFMHRGPPYTYCSTTAQHWPELVASLL